jgi:hypothetical protein
VPNMGVNSRIQKRFVWNGLEGATSTSCLNKGIIALDGRSVQPTPAYSPPRSIPARRPIGSHLRGRRGFGRWLEGRTNGFQGEGFERGFAAWIDFQNPADGGLRELKPSPPSVSSVSPPKPGNGLTPARVILLPSP